MKSIIILLFFILTPLLLHAQTVHITGKIFDNKNNPLAFVNVYVDGTIDGTSTDEEGAFSLETDSHGEVTLVASFIGYETYRLKGDAATMHDLRIVLKDDAKLLNEVTVYAGNFQLKGNSSMQQGNAVDLVTTAGAEGDLFKAISLLPGMQASGTDGRLLVRGGDSRESQTYIDDMHVLNPYGASPPNQQARSRYSPFLFEGINFSMGGFSPEYSQSLSSVLPMYTKDVSKQDKLGVNLMNVSLGSGGTKAWKRGSASFDFNYINLDLYNKMLYPSQNKDWLRAVQIYSVQNQFRFQLGDNTYLKTFTSFDNTSFKHKETVAFTEQKRDMDFDENNLFTNITLKSKTSGNVNLFAGAAYSWNKRDIYGALAANDALHTRESEIHLKTKASKRFSNLYKLEGGVETFIRNYKLSYRDTTEVNPKLDHTITGAYLSKDFNITSNLIANLSARVEHTELNKSYAFLPRVAVSYNLNRLTLSAVAGRYQQMADNDYLVYNHQLRTEKVAQYQLGAYYALGKDRLFRAEAYYKKYDKLPIGRGLALTSDGSGYSKGIDLFFSDRQVFNHWEYVLAYTYNDTERKIGNFPVAATPTYATRHNVTASLKYTNWNIKSVIGVTNRFASGRPYNDPNKDEFMNSRTPVYNTLDVSWTYLPFRWLIIYASVSNVLGRDNVFGYTYSRQPNANGVYSSKAVTINQPQSFYIGFFFTIGKNVAYEASHF